MVWQHMDYLAPLREFKDRLFHVHAKDVRIDTHKLNDVGILALPTQYHTPKLPGMGEVNWGMFCSVLGDTGYRGPVCVEVEDRAFEESLGAAQGLPAAEPGLLAKLYPISLVQPMAETAVAGSARSWGGLLTAPPLKAFTGNEAHSRSEPQNIEPRNCRISKEART